MQAPAPCVLSASPGNLGDSCAIMPANARAGSTRRWRIRLENGERTACGTKHLVPPPLSHVAAWQRAHSGAKIEVERSRPRVPATCRCVTPTQNSVQIWMSGAALAVCERYHYNDRSLGAGSVESQHASRSSARPSSSSMLHEEFALEANSTAVTAAAALTHPPGQPFFVFCESGSCKRLLE